jgi:TRAP-type mannitol/chloroaromatic compound transport system permease small subunit
MNPAHKILNGVAHAIEALSEWSGRAIAWLVLAMTLIIVYDVGMRYLFQSGSILLQELQWHLFALIFLLGAAYTLKHDGHVRVDLFYRSRYLSERGRALVDLLGSALLLIPFCLLIISGSIPFVESAYRFGESSPDPGGLPHRFLLKAAIPLGFALLVFQGIALMIRSAQTLFGWPRRDGAGRDDGEVTL